MTRAEAVKALIQREEERLVIYQHAVEQKQKRIGELKEYLYELQRPGFQYRGWGRHTKPHNRREAYIVAASDTFGQVGDGHEG